MPDSAAASSASVDAKSSDRDAAPHEFGPAGNVDKMPLLVEQGGELDSVVAAVAADHERQGTDAESWGVIASVETPSETALADSEVEQELTLQANFEAEPVAEDDAEAGALTTAVEPDEAGQDPAQQSLEPRGNVRPEVTETPEPAETAETAETANTPEAVAAVAAKEAEKKLAQAQSAS
eukprot:SAG31_NODE_9299_length_1302_cov_1.406484_1_plen_179_part_10